MKNQSSLSPIFIVLIIVGMFLTAGCDMGTYGRRMKDKAEPVQSGTNQAAENAVAADSDESDSTGE